jgi:hypothetical protein
MCCCPCCVVSLWMSGCIVNIHKGAHQSAPQFRMHDKIIRAYTTPLRDDKISRAFTPYARPEKKLDNIISSAIDLINFYCLLG